MDSISVTFPVFHADMSPLNDVAFENLYHNNIYTHNAVKSVLSLHKYYKTIIDNSQVAHVCHFTDIPFPYGSVVLSALIHRTRTIPQNWAFLQTLLHSVLQLDFSRMDTSCQHCCYHAKNLIMHGRNA